MSLQLNAPQPLPATHILNEFECGEAVLDEWLKRRAMTNQMSGASRTFVVTDQDSRVYGYYAMAAGALSGACVEGRESESHSLIQFNMHIMSRARYSYPPYVILQR